MTNHCRDCRWWDQSNGSVVQTEARRCELGSRDVPGHPLLFWGLSDGSYKAEVETMPDFGCVLWEAKEAT